jgi:hypothetical protein
MEQVENEDHHLSKIEILEESLRKNVYQLQQDDFSFVLPRFHEHFELMLRIIPKEKP